MGLYYNKVVNCIIIHYSAIVDYVTVYYGSTMEEATGQRYYMYYFVVLGLEPRALSLLVKFSMTKLYSKFLLLFFPFLKYLFLFLRL